VAAARTGCSAAADAFDLSWTVDFLLLSSCLSHAASLLCLRSRCVHKFVVPIPSFFIPPRDTAALHNLHVTLLASIQLSSNSVYTILFFELLADDVPNCANRLDIFTVARLCKGSFICAFVGESDRPMWSACSAAS